MDQIVATTKKGPLSFKDQDPCKGGRPNMKQHAILAHMQVDCRSEDTATHSDEPAGPIGDRSFPMLGKATDSACCQAGAKAGKAEAATGARTQLSVN